MPQPSVPNNPVTFYNRIISDAIDVFDKIALLELRRAARWRSHLKTSFSRSNPVARGQATPIQHRLSDERQSLQTTTMPRDKLPSYVRLLFRFRSARPSTTSLEPASDATLNPKGQNPTPGSLQINLLFTIYAEQASSRRRCKPCFSSRRQTPMFKSSTHTAHKAPRRSFGGLQSAALEERDSVRTKYGGAERDRTADPLLAKQVLSQLSYSPISSIARGKPRFGNVPRHGSSIPQPSLAKCKWWAREDLNFRPHAYQACALTN